MNSLLNPPEAQQDLPLAGASFLDESVVELATSALESRGDHTAAHLFLKNPQLYKAACFMYASGSAGQLKIAAVLKMSVHTVRAIIHREKLTRGAAMDTVKTLESMSDLRAMTLETLIEKLSDPEERRKIPFDKLMIGIGIQTEKIELLRGNATERIEHVESAPASDEFNRWLREGSIDVTASETGLSGREDGTKGDRAAGLLPPPAFPSIGPLVARVQKDADDVTGIPNNMDNVGVDVENIGDSRRLLRNDVDCDVIPKPCKGIPGGSEDGFAPGRRAPLDPSSAPTHAQGGRGSIESTVTVREDE